ncbi:aldo/keto reductase [Bacillus lacus]|uniref:Aldo/keto reductase n=1 Tax=Metabacillus lacus TaxID=1983721 RepID=A0A7X2M082_9BACI|nr:aldo/keto reductase [Metabacillus lacus]MRX74316.1 aldo/keto reductase [Metabacillus lacus]
MKKKQLGSSDLFVSRIGLGCMSLGTDYTHAKRLIDTAIENGINYLDTADLYDNGVNEEIIGKAVKNRRSDLILATKAGNRRISGKDGWTWDPSKAHIKEAVKGSLKRLQTDYIDLYQLHGGTIEDNIDETIEAFEELKTEGLIRHYGISSIRPNVIREYLQKSSIVSIMMQYSLLDRRPEELFPLIEQHGVSVIARGPMAKGLLSGRPLNTAGTERENGYLSYSFEELQKALPEIKEAGKPHSAAEAAIQYCLHSDAVAAAIPGASKEEQIMENASAAAASALRTEQIERLREAAKPTYYEQHR